MDLQIQIQIQTRVAGVPTAAARRWGTTSPAAPPTPTRKPTRVVLRTSKLDKEHPILKETEQKLYQGMDQALHKALGVGAQTVRRLGNGDTTIMLAT